MGVNPPILATLQLRVGKVPALLLRAVSSVPVEAVMSRHQAQVLGWRWHCCQDVVLGVECLAGALSRDAVDVGPVQVQRGFVPARLDAFRQDC